MFVLPDLLYPVDSLAPAMSAVTLKTHHDKHHAKYVETTNQLIDTLGWRTPTLEEVIREAAKSGKRKLYNNAAQAWNHGFFWLSMSPQKTKPSDALMAAIDRDLGGMAKLRTTFIEEAANHFGSGWAWLIAKSGKLEVKTTHDADDWLTQTGVRPLLVCDVWEHAYYLDYKNDRKAFLEAWFDQLAEWSFASRQFEAHDAWAYPARVHEPV
jgi:Fe-Mn family superoxide dismutase